jgi:hypothetical protein
MPNPVNYTFGLAAKYSVQLDGSIFQLITNDGKSDVQLMRDNKHFKEYFKMQNAIALQKKLNKLSRKTRYTIA